MARTTGSRSKGRGKAAGRRSASSKSSARKASVRKTGAKRKAAASKASARKPKSRARKATAAKSTARRTAPKRSARKRTASRSTLRKTAARAASSRKPAASRKTQARKPAASRKAQARKPAAKKILAKKPSVARKPVRPVGVASVPRPLAALPKAAPAAKPKPRVETGRPGISPAETTAEITRSVVGAALAAGTGVAEMARHATETMLEQAGSAGRAAGEFTDRMLSSVSGHGHLDEPESSKTEQPARPGPGQGQNTGGQR